MNIVWVAVGLGLVGGVLFLMSWRRANQAEDMGAVNHQWIAEHRLGSQDARR